MNWCVCVRVCARACVCVSIQAGSLCLRQSKLLPSINLTKAGSFAHTCIMTMMSVCVCVRVRHMTRHMFKYLEIMSIELLQETSDICDVSGNVGD